MLKQSWMTVICFCVFRAIFPAPAVAQTANPVAINATNFAMIGITRGQTLQINVVAYPPDPCIGQLSFVNTAGIQVGNAIPVQLAPGQAVSLDLPGSTVVTKLGQREEVRPVVTSSSGVCVASTEVYASGLGITVVYSLPNPCNQLNSSCAVF